MASGILLAKECLEGSPSRYATIELESPAHTRLVTHSSVDALRASDHTDSVLTTSTVARASRV
eukprot:4878516-Amphidinium_carterae.1